MPRLIYALSEGKDGPVKVGISSNPGSRRQELQCGNPRALKIAGVWEVRSRTVAYRAERLIHEALFASLLRLHSEWFGVSEEAAIAVIDQAVNQANADYDRSLGRA